MGNANPLSAGQIRHRPGDPANAVLRTRGQPHSRGGLPHQLLTMLVQCAMLINIDGRKISIRLALSGELAFMRARDALPNTGRGFTMGCALQRFRRQGRQLLQRQQVHLLQQQLQRLHLPLQQALLHP